MIYKKLGKHDSFGFLKKNFILPKMRKMDHFWAQNQHFELSYKSVHWIFLKLDLITGIKK